MDKSGKTVIRAVVVFACLVVFFFLIRAAAGALGDQTTIRKPVRKTSFSSEKIALVNISGPIYYSARVIENLERYGKDDSIKAIVLRIDSPGGGVSACQEITAEIKKVKRTGGDGVVGYGKPVIVSFGTVAASGGYYIGCYGDKVFSNPGTLTGSIGVIMSNLNIEELLSKVGIKEEVIKSGKFKDTGSSMRKMTTEERQLLQGVIDDVYSQFVDAVAEGREQVFAEKIRKAKGYTPDIKVSRAEIIAEIKKYADGRIFSGNQAKAYGFVDELGTEEDAINWAAEHVGIKGEPTVVSPRKPSSMFEKLFGDNEMEERLRTIFHKNGLSYMYGK